MLETYNLYFNLLVSLFECSEDAFRYELKNSYHFEKRTIEIIFHAMFEKRDIVYQTCINRFSKCIKLELFVLNKKSKSFLIKCLNDLIVLYPIE